LSAANRAAVPARYPLAPDQIALSHYRQRVTFDYQLRNDPRYAAVDVDDLLAQRLRDAMAGKLSDAELSDLIGGRIERFRAAGNLSAEVGSDEWRQIARALCVAEYEALSRMVERDEGDFTGSPVHPLLAKIGRASCRERVESWGGAGAGRKKSRRSSRGMVTAGML